MDDLCPLLCLFAGGGFAAFVVFALVRGGSGARGALAFAPDQSIAIGSGWGAADATIARLVSASPARGILLGVSITGRRTKHRGQRFEIRQCRVDVEPQGFLPYEVIADVYIPANLLRDVLPGSTMEVRVDSSNLGYVLVIGPDVGYAQGSVRTAS